VDQAILHRKNALPLQFNMPGRMRLKVRKKYMTALFTAVMSLLMACQPDPSTYRKEPPREAVKNIYGSVGAESLLGSELHLLTGKRVAIVANQTSVCHSGTHLVDTLLSQKVNVVKIFSPEHGFRGDHDAGQHVNSMKDDKTGLPLVSLYGSQKKPTAAMLADVDVVVFDIQDVGTRFYTYISTLSLVMEACAELGKEVIVCDRINPHIDDVAGPVREAKFKSFVGMHPVPIVYGMSIGEYAKMVNGEGWLEGGVKCNLIVIPCEGYTREFGGANLTGNWIPPSPNLATEESARLYPILCWYEGMPVSVGRGTDSAFTMIGAPWHEGYKNQTLRDSALYGGEPGTMNLYGLESKFITFTPRSLPGKAAHPLYENQKCYGALFTNHIYGKELFLAGLSLLKNFEEESRTVHLGEPLFQPYFDTLVGNDILKQQIKAGLSPEEIMATWQPGIDAFMKIRAKYLIYPEY
jgi:uncharacterized protein YbbC (DUF1343 family)